MRGQELQSGLIAYEAGLGRLKHGVLDCRWPLPKAICRGLKGFAAPQNEFANPDAFRRRYHVESENGPRK
jgi:hypothetical protein